MKILYPSATHLLILKKLLPGRRNDTPMTIPVNGYLSVYLSNATSFAQCAGCLNSEGDVYFDKLKINFTRGNLKEETHYYPFGLPMAGMGSSATGMTPNRQKYQSNEYITDAGLNWMSFGARQYDPQLGRFLSVDPMASQGGQDMLSPYQVMGNEPVSMTDPGGTILPLSAFASFAGIGIPGGPSTTAGWYIPPINLNNGYLAGQWINTFGGAVEGLEGPSTNDYPPSFNIYRDVIVNPNYIYLFNSNPDQTIIFKRP